MKRAIGLCSPVWGVTLARLIVTPVLRPWLVQANALVAV